MTSRTRTNQASNHAAVLGVTCVALATVVAANASLNVAIPSIARTTHASQTQLAWIIDAYSLIFAGLLLPAGALGDRYGRRRTLLAGLVIFGLGSLAAMTVHSPDPLIVLRGLIGVGAALVMPSTLSTITTTFPTEARARAVSIWAGVAGASAIIGLLTSGLLLEAFSWRSVFALNVALAAAAIVGTWRVVPESADPDAQPLDVPGSGLAVAGLMALVYSVIEAPNHGWLTARTLVGLVAGLVILTGFVAWELRAEHPMLNPRLFARHRVFAASSLSIFIQFMAFFGFAFIILQYVQIVRGDSALIAAVSLLPMGLTMMPTARLTPRLAERVGGNRVCVAGLGLIAVGMVVMSTLGSDSSYWRMFAGLVTLGAGMGAAMTPATTAITEALPASQQGVGSAVNDLARELGGAIGIAVLGSILAASYRSHLHLAGVPEPLASKARSSLGVAAQLGGTVAQQARGAFVDGLQLALLCAAGIVCVVAVAVGLMARADRRTSPADDSADGVTLPRQDTTNDSKVVTAGR